MDADDRGRPDRRAMRTAAARAGALLVAQSSGNLAMFAAIPFYEDYSSSEPSMPFLGFTK